MNYKVIKTANVNRSNAVLILEKETEWHSKTIYYRLKIIQGNVAITLELSYGNQKKAESDFDKIIDILLTISGDKE